MRDLTFKNRASYI